MKNLKTTGDINILIACEESQRVCIAFRERGFRAFSCDILPCSGNHPEWHIQEDVSAILNGDSIFNTQDGKLHFIDKWALIIAHPPCTRLCLTGQRWLYHGTQQYQKQKREEQQKAIEFFMLFTKLTNVSVAIENPVGIMNSLYRKPDFIYNPYDFEGETECKRTCLWLIDLPPLKKRETPLPKEQRTHNIYKGYFDRQYSWGSVEIARLRSQTPCGVAVAMAEQWGDFLISRLKGGATV